MGTQRTRNEDSYLIAGDYALNVVADGMGGHLGGDIASNLATATIKQHFHDGFEKANRRSSRRRDSDFLRKAIAAANVAVFDKGNANEDLRDMGTTIVAAWFRHNYVVAGSVGDSRIYRLRGDVFSQVTIDHSWVGELRRRRLISEEEAAHHPLKNIITRALGMDRKVNVDIFLEDLQDGDVYILCTDGLTDFVDDSRIADIMKRHREDFQTACDKLIELANFMAGADNITVGLCRVVEVAGDGTNGAHVVDDDDPDDDDSDS
ncbi:MAG: Stp1/IreP family PP2C-type Ser/Thr phosphatase [Planctomycetota bacterium]